MTDKTPQQLINKCATLERDLSACRSKNIRYLNKINKLVKKVAILEEKLKKANTTSRFFSQKIEKKD